MVILNTHAFLDSPFLSSHANRLVKGPRSSMFLSSSGGTSSTSRVLKRVSILGRWNYTGQIDFLTSGSFLWFQVDSGHIYYVHDGSDTLSDNFTIIANDTDTRKHSQPCMVFVHVTPVNDEAPVITANGILRLSVLVCLKHICVITEMEELKYALEGTWETGPKQSTVENVWGYLKVALVSWFCGWDL